MKDRNTTHVRITEGSSDSSSVNDVQENRKLQLEKLRKPIIYFLMAIVCSGCLYLIFKPKEKTTVEDVGFNSIIPQAADDQLQSDKQKAYEQQLLENKKEEKRNALTTLSDYWTDPATSKDGNMESVHAQSPTNPNRNILQGDQNAVNSYRNAQQTLGSFYSRDDQEISQLKREINRLKNESSRKDTAPAGTTINDQLELMEKSYQMAAKYLPMSSKQEKPEEKKVSEKQDEQKKRQVTPVQNVRKNMVSSLYREVSDSAFLADLHQNRFNNLQSGMERSSLTQNSIRAVIHETKTITAESMVTLRLSEAMLLANTVIPAGMLLKAIGKFQGGRLQLKILTIEYNGTIQQVEINVHDNDGQPGFSVPYSPEQNAVTDILANMGQTSGTNIMMTQSAGQQIAADLTKGVIQGVSGYFQKKVRLPKVTVKAGQEVFLVSKK